MNIGRPKRIIEIEPASLPLPEPVAPLPEVVPAPAPTEPIPAPSEPPVP